MFIIYSTGGGKIQTYCHDNKITENGIVEVAKKHGITEGVSIDFASVKNKKVSSATMR